MCARRLSVLVLALVLAACDAAGPDADDAPTGPSTPVASPTAEDSFVIGLVGTMRDARSPRGEDAFEGADVAVSVMNRGADGGPTFELVSLDDGGDPDTATSYVRSLAESPRTVGVVYAGPPEGLPPAGQALERAGIPGVLVYGDLYSARLLRHPFFQVSPPLLWQARRLAAYIKRDRRYASAGILAEESLQGRTAIASLRNALGDTRRPPRRPAVQSYTPGETDLRPALEALRERRVSALVVQGTPATFAGVVDTLDDMGSEYRGTRAARRGARAGGRWRPHVMGFDLAISPASGTDLPPGTVAAETYARGAHYLPVPSFETFRSAYEDWWGAAPVGWELRGFEAARMIGWAAARADEDTSVIDALESLRGRRFGGLDVAFGPDDHTAVEPAHVGLWVVPRPGAALPERDRLPENLPWVPLARGFSIDGRRTDIAARDWEHLFRRPPPPGARAPRFIRMRFGIATPRTDPAH